MTVYPIKAVPRVSPVVHPVVHPVEIIDPEYARARTAYFKFTETVPARTRPHRSWGKTLRKQNLAPLDIDSAWRMVAEGFRLVRAQEFPRINMADESNSSWASDTWKEAAIRAIYAAGAEQVASEIVFSHSALPCGDIIGPLHGLLLTGRSETDLLFSAPAKWAFYALLARSRIGYGAVSEIETLDLDEPRWAGQGEYTLDDYEVLTLPWRCHIGPLHPEDDNDVCHDPLVELYARRLLRKNPAYDKETARVESVLAST